MQYLLVKTARLAARKLYADIGLRGSILLEDNFERAAKIGGHGNAKMSTGVSGKWLEYQQY